MAEFWHTNLMEWSDFASIMHHPHTPKLHGTIAWTLFAWIFILVMMCRCTAIRGENREQWFELEQQLRSPKQNTLYSICEYSREQINWKSMEKLNFEMQWMELIWRRSILFPNWEDDDTHIQRERERANEEKIGLNLVKFFSVCFFVVAFYHLTLNGQFHYLENRIRKIGSEMKESEKKPKRRTVSKAQSNANAAADDDDVVGSISNQLFSTTSFSSFLLDFVVAISLYMGIADIFQRPTMETEKQKMFYEMDICVSVCVCSFHFRVHVLLNNVSASFTSNEDERNSFSLSSCRRRRHRYRCRCRCRHRHTHHTSPSGNTRTR